jgi:metal-dependent amidase/aminoacylase/carboxypeptidase family protein
LRKWRRLSNRCCPRGYGRFADSGSDKFAVCIASSEYDARLRTRRAHACALGAAIFWRKENLRVASDFFFSRRKNKRTRKAKAARCGFWKKTRSIAFRQSSPAHKTFARRINRRNDRRGSSSKRHHQNHDRGRAAHGAHPEEGIDAIAIPRNHYGDSANRFAPVSPFLRRLSITTINGGIKENVMPKGSNSAELSEARAEKHGKKF